MKNFRASQQLHAIWTIERENDSDEKFLRSSVVMLGYGCWDAERTGIIVGTTMSDGSLLRSVGADARVSVLFFCCACMRTPRTIGGKIVWRISTSTTAADSKLFLYSFFPSPASSRHDADAAVSGNSVFCCVWLMPHCIAEQRRRRRGWKLSQSLKCQRE